MSQYSHIQYIIQCTVSLWVPLLFSRSGAEIFLVSRTYIGHFCRGSVVSPMSSLHGVVALEYAWPQTEANQFTQRELFFRVHSLLDEHKPSFSRGKSKVIILSYILHRAKESREKVFPVSPLRYIIIWHCFTCSLVLKTIPNSCLHEVCIFVHQSYILSGHSKACLYSVTALGPFVCVPSSPAKQGT